MINSSVAHIVYASDDKFSEILGVSLTSLYENSKDMEDICVYVLQSGISEENQKRLISLSSHYGRSPICFIKAKDITKELSVNVNTDRGSVSQYARLFISSALPQDLERVLYLDCDIIVNQSISKLWNLSMHGKTIAALKDAFSASYRKNIELRPHDIMFNSGVMLVDLKQWKSQNTEERLMKFIKKKHGIIQQGDQGALNAVLSKDIFCFSPVFNSVTIFYDFSYQEILKYRKPVDFYSEEQVRQAVKNPVIIHFTTSFLSERPWISGSKHPYRNKWMYFKSRSPWKDTPLWKQKFKHSAMIKTSKVFPRRMLIAVSGLLQAYGRPFFYSIKDKLS